MTPLDQLLKKEEELRAKATPGPYQVRYRAKCCSITYQNEKHGACEMGATNPATFYEDDARNIVHTVNVSQTKSEIIRVLVEALEGFRLGHAHGPDLDHTRKLGNSYGWCDHCATKVSWGPGYAEEALSKAQALAEKGLK